MNILGAREGDKNDERCDDSGEDALHCGVIGDVRLDTLMIIVVTSGCVDERVLLNTTLDQSRTLAIRGIKFASIWHGRLSLSSVPGRNTSGA